MMYKFWVLWVCLPLCSKLKVVLLNICLLYHCTHFCFVNISHFVELDESMLDGLGILPQRKQHKKLLLVCCFFHSDLLHYVSIWLFSVASICQHGQSVGFLLLIPRFLQRILFQVILLLLWCYPVFFILKSSGSVKCGIYSKYTWKLSNRSQEVT